MQVCSNAAIRHLKTFGFQHHESSGRHSGMNTSAGSCTRPAAVSRLPGMPRSRSCAAAATVRAGRRPKGPPPEKFFPPPKRKHVPTFSKKAAPRPSALRQPPHTSRRRKIRLGHIQKNFTGLPLAPRKEIDKPVKCYLHYCGPKRHLAPCPATCRAAVGISSRSFCYRKSTDIRPSSRRSWRSACR